MDISVSHLNRRMALQVPPELPLGLVFIVGHVQNLQEDQREDQTLDLQLRDEQHVLDCRLPKRIVDETLLKEGDRVRMGGQLTFDAQAARYQLFAHHLEVLVSRPQTTAPGHPTSAGVHGGRQQVALAPPELPHWVRKLAPPEIQRELGFAVESDVPETESATSGGREMDIPTAPTSQTTTDAKSADFIADLPPDMVRFLSQAIDSEDEIELTPEMLVAFGAAGKGNAPRQGNVADEGGPRRTRVPSRDGARERRVEQADGEDELVQSIAAWLSTPQLYLIPLFMLLIFLTAMFIFVLSQQ